MEKLVELSDQEALIEFQLNCKCRANVRLKSLNPTTPIAFKVQTSSPHKFLVNPPNGLIPPLSYATFQIVLKPQSQLPSSFPRSPSDRFLIKTAEFNKPNGSTQSESIMAWFNSETELVTYDLKLKVAFVGIFLLRHAISVNDVDAVKNIVKRQKSIVTDLSESELESLTQLITESNSSERLVQLLCEAGLRMTTPTPTRSKLDNGNGNGNGDTTTTVEKPKGTSNGWTDLQVAAAFDRKDDVTRLIKEALERGESLDGKDKDGCTAMHVGANKGNVEVVKMLAEGGADINSKSNNGQTALYAAAANGDRQMVDLLMELGANPVISTDNNGRTSIDIAREKGHVEIVKTLEQGDFVLTAARRGQVKDLQQLLRKGGNPNYADQYGLTSLHVAAIKGHTDIISVLIEFGMDIECKDKEGHTALHLAVEGGNLETVELLVNNGAKVNTTTTKGATPIYLAKAMGYDNILEFLLSKGAPSPSPSLPSSSSSFSSML